jgi:hypothetical protein
VKPPRRIPFTAVSSRTRASDVRPVASARSAAVALAVLALLGSVSFADAQPRPSRPLFGGAAAPAEGRQALDLTLTFAGGYDDDAFAEAVGLGRTTGLLSGFFGALAGDLRYALRGRRVRLAANLGSSLRYFADPGEVVPVGHYAGVGFSLALGSRTTLSFNQAASHTPSPLYGLFARAAIAEIGAIVPPGTDYAIADVRSYTYASTVNLTRRAGRRGTISVASGYRRMFSDGDLTLPVAVGFPSLTAFDVGGSYSHGLSRDLSLRLGYTYRQAEYAERLRPRYHDLDIGIDYNRPLSRSRRTRLGFGVGSAIAEEPLPGSLAETTVRQYRARAHVSLIHQMGRTWTARADYRRGGQFVEGLASPLYTDGVTLGLDGFLTRRADLSASAAYSAGDGWGLVSAPFETYTGTLRLRVGLTRALAAHAEYLFYHYDFARAPELLPFGPRRLDRHGVRVGLSVWVPIVAR